MDNHVADIETLRKAYCPPLDEALFYAISSEYELPRDGNSLSNVLDDLKYAALEQENAEFDPSGTGGLDAYKDFTDASRSSPGEGSASNGVTSITTGVSELKWSEEGGLGENVERIPNDQKGGWLAKVFPGLSAEQISETLARNGASLDKATDELLNLAFLTNEQGHDHETSPPVPKGVEAFAEATNGRPRKGRSKKKPRTNESSRASSVGSVLADLPANNSNVWSTMTEDIEYITSRTSLHPQAVKSVYHSHGARLAPTITEFAIKEGSAWNKLHETNPVMQYQIAEFRKEFSSVPEAQLYGILVLSRNIPSAAQELLEVMVASPDLQPVGKVRGMAHYAPVELGHEDHPNPHATPSWTTVRTGNTRELAAVHGISASQAFSQASSAYKKSKSDRLMGGAAAYYASEGHKQIKMAKEYQSAAADAHVTAQSTSSVLDLHGVSVSDAVHIARYRTQLWWDSLGDAKYASGGGGPARADYKIVTGVGSHSKNHAPRIGPAVSKMLVREGWKVEIGHGELIVVGKVRR